MTTSLKTLFAAAIALSFTACSTDTSKNADGSTTTTVTTPSAEQVGDKMEAKADQAGDKMEAAGDKMEAKMDAAGDNIYFTTSAIHKTPNWNKGVGQPREPFRIYKMALAK